MGRLVDAGIYVTPILAEWLNETWGEDKKIEFYDAWEALAKREIPQMPFATVTCLGARGEDEPRIGVECSVTFYIPQIEANAETRLYASDVLNEIEKNIPELNSRLSPYHIELHSRVTSIEYTIDQADIRDGVMSAVEFRLQTIDAGGA